MLNCRKKDLSSVKKAFLLTGVLQPWDGLPLSFSLKQLFLPVTPALYPYWVNVPCSCYLFSQVRNEESTLLHPPTQLMYLIGGELRLNYVCNVCKVVREHIHVTMTYMKHVTLLSCHHIVPFLAALVQALSISVCTTKGHFLLSPSL